MKKINVVDLKKLFDAYQVVLVDVREKDEYEAEHIEGAISVPLSELSESNLPNALGGKLVIYCRSGIRSCTAYEKVKAFKSDLEEVYSLEGGITAWKKKKYPVKKGEGFCMPISQQVHIFIGFSVLVFSLLGYLFDNRFSLLSAFFGLGLLFAGLTGFCGLAILLMKAPWNKKNKAKLKGGSSCCSRK